MTELNGILMKILRINRPLVGRFLDILAGRARAPVCHEKEREEITSRFKGQYCDLARSVGAEFNAVSHWGKLEMPTNGQNFLELRQIPRR